VSKVVSRTFDKLNRQLTENEPGSFTTSYTWDAASNLASLADAGGTVTYSYDPANLLSSIAEPLKSGQTAPATTTFGYDVRNNRTSTLFPNGVAMTAGYDGSNKMTSVSYKKGTSTLRSQTYTYEPAVDPNVKTGLVQTITDEASKKQTFTYDTMDRLQQAVERDSSSTERRRYEYDYDAASNRKQQRISGPDIPSGLAGTTSYAYNQANMLCWVANTALTGQTCGAPPAGATTFTYDKTGNETGSSSGRSHTFNARGQKTSFTLPGLTARSLGYLSDGHNDLITNGGSSYRNDRLGLGVRTNGGTSAYYTRDPSGTPIGVRLPNGTSDYYMVDHLGGVECLRFSGHFSLGDGGCS